MPSSQKQAQSQPQTEPNDSTTKSGSKKGLFIIILIIILLIIGAPVYAFKTGLVAPPSWLMSALPGFMLPAVSRLLPEGVGSGEIKLATMMETGRSGECQFTHKTRGDSITYYIRGENYRIEAQETINNESIESYIIFDGDYQYMWSNQEDFGTKIKVSDFETEEEPPQLDNDYIQDWTDPDFAKDWEEPSVENEYEIECQFKNISRDLFTPPSDIEFLDMDDWHQFPFEDIDLDAYTVPDEDSTAPNESETHEAEPQQESATEVDMPSQEDLEDWEGELEEWVEQMQQEFDLE